MRKQNKKSNPVLVGCNTAALSFVALSFLASGLIEFSLEAGLWKWLLDSAAYLILNKLGAKLVASLLIGFAGYFVSSMIEYGKEVKSRKHARAMRVSFQKNQQTGVSKSA